MIDARQVERNAIARPDQCVALTMRLHRANSHVAAGDGHLLIGAQRAARQRAGDHRAASFRGEHTVHPQPRPTTIEGARRLLHERVERGT